VHLVAIGSLPPEICAICVICKSILNLSSIFRIRRDDRLRVSGENLRKAFPVPVRANVQGGFQVPIFEYRCSGCGHVFERFTQRTSTEPPACPACGKPEVERVLSAFAGRVSGGGCGSTPSGVG
jgi:putative FmdB family regulatory protein